MSSVLLNAITEGVKDTAICIPILFATYLFMEILEGSSKINEETLCRYSRKVGPAIGGVLGVIPQCGLAGSAAALYSTGTVTLGTMLAVFFATSDEMLPLLISSQTDVSVILKIIHKYNSMVTLFLCLNLIPVCKARKT